MISINTVTHQHFLLLLTRRVSMAGDDKKITVNGTTTTYNPTTQDLITTAMVQTGGIKRIQHNLQHRLDEAGWSQNLREYLERLFRSGEVTTYDEALKLVTQHIMLQPESDETPRSTVHGGLNGAGVPDLVLPRQAVKDAAGYVRAELEKVVQVDGKK